MNEFKAGMQVYSPTEGTQVFTAFNWNESEDYPIGVGEKIFTECGMYLCSDHYPSIFHATKENQALLEALYGVKFDDPPLSDKEKVIEALENAGGKPVVCWAKSNNNYWFIKPVLSCVNGKLFYSQEGECYTDVKPLSSDEFALA